MHYYKFNIADWQSSTRHLSVEEEAVYFRLINHYYDTEKPIPLETQPVIRRLVLGSHADIVQSILDEFFVKTERGYEKEKCNQIIKEYKKTSKKNKENGAKGGRPAKNAVSKVTESKPSGLNVGSQIKPTGNPNQELRTTNDKLKTNNDKPIDKQCAAKAAVVADADAVIDYLNVKTGQNYKHSKTSRKDIIARLNEKFTVQDCMTVIDKKCAQWINTDSAQYLRPITLFGNKFEGYLNQIDKPVNLEFSDTTRHNIEVLNSVELK